MDKLSKSDRETLNRAIAEAESRTQTHLALVVVPASDRYAMYPLAYGALFALLLAGVMAILWPRTLVGPAVLGEVLAFVAFSLVFDWLPLRLLLVPRAVWRTRAQNLAHREFAARILTTHRGGLLLFVSLGERYVELLADRELHAKVGQASWDRIVGELTADAKTKSLRECLLAAIASCSAAIQTSSRTLH
jgi:putative membrane protein